MAHSLGRWQETPVLHWLLAEDFIRSHMGLSIRLCECPYDIVAGFSQNERSKRERERERVKRKLSCKSLIVTSAMFYS